MNEPVSRPTKMRSHIVGAVVAGSALALVLSACGATTSATEPSVSPSQKATATKSATPEFKPAPTQNWMPPAGSKYIYLTLDDGPGSNTIETLDVLKANDIKATFFLIGKMVRTREAMVKRILDEGHAIGNHTYDHADLATLSKAGIQDQLEHAAEKIGPEAGACFRPPYGAINDTVRQVASKLGMQPVLWTLDTNDWSPSTTGAAIAAKLRQAKPGDVILAHDAGGDRSGTVAGLKAALPELIKKGYEFAPVPICMPGTREPIN